MSKRQVGPKQPPNILIDVDKTAFDKATARMLPRSIAFEKYLRVSFQLLLMRLERDLGRAPQSEEPPVHRSWGWKWSASTARCIGRATIPTTPHPPRSESDPLSLDTWETELTSVGYKKKYPPDERHQRKLESQKKNRDKKRRANQGKREDK